MTAEKKFYTYLSLFATSAWIWLGYSVARPDSQATVCLFRNIIALPCPSCGITRSANALLHTHWIEAFMINPLGYLAVLLLCIVPLWLIADVILRSASFYRFYHSSERWLKSKPAIMVIFFGLIAANWIWNIFKHI